jgi:poly(3-hydroxybutyrate) depolymerase
LAIDNLATSETSIWTLRNCICALLWALPLGHAHLGAAQPLPPAGAEPSGTTVSGISSGGYMAVQFHIAHSSRVRGVAALAAGPYYCAQGSAVMAVNNCMRPNEQWPVPSVKVLVAATETLAGLGLVDTTSSLKRARVWLFSGGSDATVDRRVVESLHRYYLHYVPAEQVAFVRDVDAGHAMVTADYGNGCGVTRAPYINDCDFDAAAELLTHLYGPLKAPAPRPSGTLQRFDQRPFAAPSAYSISMANEGQVYIPAACAKGGCRVHAAFHGCLQAGDEFPRHAGYNRWADTNRLIVLYPQAIARFGWGPWPWPTSFVYNPNGCWDWWGYTNAEYHTQRGAQIRAVKAMLDRLGQRPD